jgi:thiol-disulfide isomerase/thioredoxin
LTVLAVGGEAEKPVDHATLARIYLLLDRPADAVPHAEAAVTADEESMPPLILLATALSGVGRVDDAEAAFRKLLDRQFAEAEAAQFVASSSAALSSLVGGLNGAGKFDAAERLVGDWQTKLAAFRSDDDGVKQAIERSQGTVRYLQSRIAGEKARAALIGQAYFPIEQATWLNGAPVSPEQLHGKVVLLDFWAVWCGPCIATFPHLIDWQEKYAAQGLVIIGVTRRYQFDWDADGKKIKQAPGLKPEQEDAATAAFARHHRLKHRLAVVSNADDPSKRYGVTGIPQVVVIDGNGIIRLIKVGSNEVNAKAVESEIRKLLGLETSAAAR